MKISRWKLYPIVAVLVLINLSACETLKGAGRDLQGLGGALERATQ